MNTLNSMNENEKIMNIIEKVFKATNPETSVTLEQVIEKGIEMGVAEDYPRGKEDGHPWYPRTSVMMGVSDNVNALMENEEFHLHRRKMRKNGKGCAFFYWVDRTKMHKTVKRNQKAEGNKDVAKSNYSFTYNSPVPGTPEMMQKTMAENPGKFRMVNGKLVSEDWIAKNPDKFQRMYGNM